MMTGNDAMREIVQISEEYWLYDLPPVVCMTHLRFLPCRARDNCVFRDDPEAIEVVRKAQMG
jgi:hypothetical protein